MFVDEKGISDQKFLKSVSIWQRYGH